MKRVVICFDRDGTPNYLIEAGAQVQVLCLDDRCPHDRVYELTNRFPAAKIDELIGTSPIGSQFDERHPGAKARIEASMAGKPHHLTVVDD